MLRLDTDPELVVSAFKLASAFGFKPTNPLWYKAAEPIARELSQPVEWWLAWPIVDNFDLDETHNFLGAIEKGMRWITNSSEQAPMTLKREDVAPLLSTSTGIAVLKCLMAVAQAGPLRIECYRSVATIVTAEVSI
jgi:hypothetical protein